MFYYFLFSQLLIAVKIGSDIGKNLKSWLVSICLLEIPFIFNKKKECHIIYIALFKRGNSHL